MTSKHLPAKVILAGTDTIRAEFGVRDSNTGRKGTLQTEITAIKIPIPL